MNIASFSQYFSVHWHVPEDWGQFYLTTYIFAVLWYKLILKSCHKLEYVWQFYVFIQAYLENVSW